MAVCPTFRSSHVFWSKAIWPTNIWPTQCFVNTTIWSAISNGREPRSCLGRIFNFKLGCTALLHNFMARIQPLLELKTRPRFCPVSLSSSMSCHSAVTHLVGTIFVRHNIWSTQYLVDTIFGRHTIRFTQYLVNTIFGQHNIWSTQYLVDTIFGR
jgi:hypothetical protein